MRLARLPKIMDRIEIIFGGMFYVTDRRHVFVTRVPCKGEAVRFGPSGALWSVTQVIHELDEYHRLDCAAEVWVKQ